MKIGILGTGKMGSAIGRRLINSGYNVHWGSRSSERAKRLANSVSPDAMGGNYRDAAKFGDFVVLASKWQQVQGVIEAAGTLEEKILIDATNPEKVDDYGLEIGHTTSGAEQIKEWAKGAKIVKAFNHIYAEVIDNVEAFEREKATAFYCGDDAEAKNLAATIIKDMGFDPIDCGNLQNARYLEPLAQLIVQLVRVQGMDPVANTFKLMK